MVTGMEKGMGADAGGPIATASDLHRLAELACWPACW